MCADYTREREREREERENYLHILEQQQPHVSYYTVTHDNLSGSTNIIKNCGYFQPSSKQTIQHTSHTATSMGSKRLEQF
jgi:hypothetical protein